jgi:hypothetical protein
MKNEMRALLAAAALDRGTVVLRSETRNQRDEIAQVLTSKLVVHRKPQAPVLSNNSIL